MEDFPYEFGEDVAALHIERSEIGAFDVRQYDPLADAIATIPSLFDRSREGARLLAENHRGIRVGCAAVAYASEGDEGRRGIFVAGNFKMRLKEDERGPHDVEDVDKVCAEMRVMLAAEEAGFDRIAAMVVAGTMNRRKIQEITFVPSLTLHPCAECNAVMGASDLVQPETAIFTTGSAPEEVRYQLQTYKQYARRYRKQADEGEFQDAKLRHYVRSEWTYKKDVYLEQLTTADIPLAPSRRSAKQQRTANRLAAQVMAGKLEL